MNNRYEIDYSSAKTLPDFLKLLHKNEVPNNLFWRYIDNYQDRKARDKGIPLSGQFELTPLCNLDCKMCYVHLNKDQLQGATLLPGDWWKDIATKAHALGMLNAVLTGGECLAYPEFDEVYLFLKNKGIRVLVKTNGILLNKERVDFFKKFAPRGITISLYGSTNDVYNQVTGKAVFDTVYDNLLLLKDVDFPVSVAITPNKYMYDDIKNIIELLAHLAIPYTVNAKLFPPRKETGRELCDISAYEYLNIFKLLRQNNASDTIPPAETELQECDITDIANVGIRCSAGRSFFNISWNGIMSGCPNLDSLSINLLENDFETAWKLINADALSFLLPIECVKCKYNEACFKCAAYRQNRDNKGHCNPEICERTKIFIKEGIYQI